MLGRFGKFNLVERIAEGGMAEVFKATVEGPQGFERIVAIKRLHRALCEDMDLTQMLVDEARIAVQLHHPAIGNVFDLGCIENQYFIIMEYIEGTDMQAVLSRMRDRERPMPPAVMVHVVCETLSGLHYAHTKMGRTGEPLGIVHRDVSPQNIMVTWDGRVKLVDFGIAKARNRAQTTQHGIIKGKFYYMAPEQAHGHHVDARTDVFAAGMVLYEALAGRSPYDDVMETELLRAVRMADFPPPIAFRPDLDPELSALVEVATQRNPDKRFDSAADFQLALDDYRRRKLQPIGEPELGQFVRAVAMQQESGDNFQSMGPQEYTPSAESLLFDKPDDEALARAAGGEIIGNGRNKNPFADNAPTEIYDRDANVSRREQSSPFTSNQAGQNGYGNIPLDMPPPPPPGQRPFGSDSGQRPEQRRPAGPAAPPMRQRAQEKTRPSLVDRVATPKFVYAAVGVALLLVAVLAGLLYYTRSEEQPEEAIAAATASPGDEETSEPKAEAAADAARPAGKAMVAFNSDPANAQVVIDDVERGSTPLSVDLEIGKTYAVQFVRDGYEIANRDLEVNEENPDVMVQLEEAKGVLKVLSYPPDAVVLIDGEEQGTTPLTLTGLETDQSFKVLARLGKDEMEKEVAWAADGGSVQEVMFEFSGAKKTSALTTAAKAAPKKSSSTRKYRKSTTKKKRRTSTRKASASSSSSSSSDESLDVFGSSSSTKSSGSSSDDSADESSSDDESLDVFGSSSSSKKKKTTTRKKAPAKKKEEESDDDGLDVW